MRTAIGALHSLVSPCPFEAYGAAIVNHTASEAGELVCIGANAIIKEGNPTLHGEVAAINNCTAILRDPKGPYKLSAAEVTEAWKGLSLYTTAEACPMCSAAIRWSGFREYIYATSADTLLATGWDQLLPVSRELFARNKGFRSSTVLYGDVLRNETDPLLGWQFQPDAPCPTGCSRGGTGGHCLPDWAPRIQEVAPFG